MTEGPDGVFVHPLGVCESRQVGRGTRVWAFAHVLPGARIGSDCNICDGVFIENDVVIGDRVTIKNGVQLWDGVTLEDDVFVGPNATFTNDGFPRSKQRPPAFLTTVVKRGASIGANATLLPGIAVGQAAMIGAGAVVARDVPPRAIVVGNPARIVGYAGTAGGPDSETVGPRRAADRRAAAAGQPGGCRVWPLPRFGDLRGDLTAVELDADLPFVPKRVFFVYNVPSDHVRVEHAHRECTRLVLAMKGAVAIVVDDTRECEEIVLDDPGLGLLIPPRVWATQYRVSRDAVLVVFASHPYRPEDYIRDYAEFERVVRGSPDAPA